MTVRGERARWTGDGESRRRRYFDRGRNRLVYTGGSADASYWDHHWWNERDRMPYVGGIPRGNLVVRKVQEHLPLGSLVLEGGCGLAHHSWYLSRLGFVPVALDYVGAVVAAVRRCVPEVRPVHGSVFELPFRDGVFDGYLSLGVIEHYFDGFDRAAREMSRCLRPGGILLLAFPHMSRLRRLKARLGCYDAWRESESQTADFFQFALDEQRVCACYQSLGFRRLEAVRFLGATGLENEIPCVKNLVRENRHLTRKLRILVDFSLRWMSSHCILIVLRKDL